jgi:hypothetical protein
MLRAQDAQEQPPRTLGHFSLFARKKSDEKAWPKRASPRGSGIRASLHIKRPPDGALILRFAALGPGAAPTRLSSLRCPASLESPGRARSAAATFTGRCRKLRLAPAARVRQRHPVFAPFGAFAQSFVTCRKH